MGEAQKRLVRRRVELRRGDGAPYPLGYFEIFVDPDDPTASDKEWVWYVKTDGYRKNTDNFHDD